MFYGDGLASSIRICHRACGILPRLADKAHQQERRCTYISALRHNAEFGHDMSGDHAISQYRLFCNTSNLKSFHLLCKVMTRLSVMQAAANDDSDPSWM